MNKSQKVTLVESVSKDIKEAKSVVLVNYSGLTVALQQDLKAKLKEVGGRMLVVKNTLLAIAGKNAGIDENALTDTVLSGQTALILGNDDPVAPLSVLSKFAKENKVPSLKVGIVEGSFQDNESLTKLSVLPGRDALLSQVLGSLMAPSYGLVGTLNANLQKLVYVLSAKAG